MAIHYKVGCRIWWDPRFKALSDEQKVEVIQAIVMGEEVGCFAEYVGPMFRIADKPKRRPDLSTSEWRRLREDTIEELGTTCNYCGEDCADDPTVDHVEPVCCGADPLDKSNLVVACRSCNSRKGGQEGWQQDTRGTN